MITEQMILQAAIHGGMPTATIIVCAKILWKKLHKIELRANGVHLLVEKDKVVPKTEQGK